jgi:hypothetical protein
VRPRVHMDYVANAGRVNPKSFPQGYVRSSGPGQFSYLADGIVVQLGLAGSYSPRAGVRRPGLAPALAGHILGVVVVGSQKQMRGVDAGRIVAAMQNHQSARYRTDMILVRNSVRSRAKALPISESVLTAEPFPASAIGLRNARHERQKSVSASVRTEHNFSGCGLKCMATP